MEKCARCQKSYFVKLNSNGLCKNCEKIMREEIGENIYKPVKADWPNLTNRVFLSEHEFEFIMNFYIKYSTFYLDSEYQVMFQTFIKIYYLNALTKEVVQDFSEYLTTLYAPDEIVQANSETKTINESLKKICDILISKI